MTEWGVIVIAVGSLLMILFGGGCAVYQPTSVEEWLVQAKQLDGSGCVYVAATLVLTPT